METLQDLIKEAKLRTTWWALCIFILALFLSNTSKSMWMNVPTAILLVSGVRIIITKVEFCLRIRIPNRQSYLSHLERKKMSVNDSRLTTLPPLPKWKKKIDSPLVEAAMEDFVNKLLQEFVVDSWYSALTPDKEAPQLLHAVIMEVLAEISARLKDINLVDLLTRDVVDLVGEHLEVFRKIQAAIGREVMVTLSSDERDERLKHHLMASKELHPALISSESEYKFLKRIIGALLTAVLRPREAQCPVVRCIARELLTCLVVKPVMRFACPGRINELIEALFLANNNKEGKDADVSQSTNVLGQSQTPNQEKSQDLAFMKDGPSSSQKNDAPKDQKEQASNPSGPVACGPVQDELLNPPTSSWARGLEAATQRRTEILHPENLENTWTKGRNYKKTSHKNIEGFGINENFNDQTLEQNLDKVLSDQSKTSDPSYLANENNSNVHGSKFVMERSNSVSDLNIQNQVGESANVGGDVNSVNIVSDKVTRTEGCVPKLRCRVLGAHFENLDSKSFAVYSIAVTDADNKTWIVKRRYKNFDRLHQYLRNICNYKLQLPPKRIFSSSTEDAFVQKRCIQLNKYLQDLLSIAHIADQQEVWDFLSISSKSYSFGKSSSVATTLAINVDDGVMKKVKGPCLPSESSSSVANKNVSLKTDNATKITTSDLANSFSGNEEGEKDALLNHEEKVGLAAQGNVQILQKSENVTSASGLKEDPLGVPAEWSPSNVSVPLLNLVDKIFQLKRRGWLRRQVFWISKQILQLMMEDAIDDWLLRQIHFLRRDNIVAQGIHMIQDILWPEGTFFLKSRTSQTDSSQSNDGSANKNNKQGSFEEQLEAARRASDIKKMIFKGAPTTLVSLIGHKQYKRSAKDVYYFLQVSAYSYLSRIQVARWVERAGWIKPKLRFSAVCLKQLGYGLLELALISIFPELQGIILNVHE